VDAGEAAYAQTSTRLGAVGASAVRRLETYLAGGRGRRAAWGFLALALGALVANMISLTFGLYGVNDSIGAATVLLAGEFAAKTFYAAEARANATADDDDDDDDDQGAGITTNGTNQVPTKSPSKPLPLFLTLVNNFRIGVYFFLVIDAFKLNS